MTDNIKLITSNRDVIPTTLTKSELIAEFNSVKVVLNTIQQYKRKFHNMTKDELEDLLDGVFPVFKDKYPTLYKVALSTNDINMAYMMVDKMIAITNGQEDLKKSADEFGEKLAQSYIYNKVGKPNKI